tara:strand:- start:1331 stop:1510 length:180 start_codon:yes stop_codon:yes gene_type:complete
MWVWYFYSAFGSTPHTTPKTYLVAAACISHHGTQAGSISHHGTQAGSISHHGTQAGAIQ